MDHACCEWIDILLVGVNVFDAGVKMTYRGALNWPTNGQHNDLICTTWDFENVVYDNGENTIQKKKRNTFT